MLKSLAVAALSTAVLPGIAKADRDDRGRRDDDRGRHHQYDRASDRHTDHRPRHSGGGWLDLDLRTAPACPPPVVVDRAHQVWVEPVYRTVCDKVWVEPVYQTVCEKVWRDPVVEKRVERVWVPERRELREVRRGYRLTREWVCIPGHYQEVYRDVVVVPGRHEEVRRQVLVSEGHWQTVERQELVSAGHWETHVERVAVAPPARDGLRIDLRLPIRW
jgi:hypothetical protein